MKQNNEQKTKSSHTYTAPIISTDGSERDTELLYGNKVAKGPLDFAFVCTPLSTHAISNTM